MYWWGKGARLELTMAMIRLQKLANNELSCRERELTMAKKKATQKYISEFKEAREEWKVLERERMEEENRKILQFSRLQEQRENARMESKKQKEEAMARVQNAVSRFIYHGGKGK